MEEKDLVKKLQKNGAKLMIYLGVAVICIFGMEACIGYTVPKIKSFISSSSQEELSIVRSFTFREHVPSHIEKDHTYHGNNWKERGDIVSFSYSYVHKYWKGGMNVRSPNRTISYTFSRSTGEGKWSTSKGQNGRCIVAPKNHGVWKGIRFEGIEAVENFQITLDT